MQKFFFLAVVLGALVTSSCHKNNENLHTVTYHIASANTVNVSYTDNDGLTKTVNAVTSTWTYSITIPSGQTVKLKIDSTNGSDVSGTIDVDGQQAAQNNATGTVTVTAQVP